MPAALVTGAGARIGKALALDLARRGYDVGVHYATSAKGAEAVVAEIEQMGRKAIALQADLLVEAVGPAYGQQPAGPFRADPAFCSASA